MTFPRSTVVESLAELAINSPTENGFTFISDRGRSESFTSFESLTRKVAQRAGSLTAAGLRRGDHVALVIPERRDFALTFLGALWAGIIPVPLPPPIGLDHLSIYLERSRHTVDASDARMLVTTAQIKAVSGTLLRKSLRSVVAIEDLARDTSAPLELNPPAGDDTAFIQFTSGSTSRPRGVVLTHQNLAINCHCLARSGMGLTQEDVLCSWLPFFHDFGLIGMVLAPIFTGSSAVYMPPLLFLKRPIEWLRAISRHEGTVSFAPNFGYGLCTKRVKEADLKGLDLSSWRYAGCGAEPVRVGTLEAFADRFERVGFNRAALTPGYGLAESTLAVSFDDEGRGPRYDALDPEELHRHGRAQFSGAPDAVEVVCCGAPFEGHEARILDEQGRVLGDRQVGEIVLRGPSVAAGYYRNSQATNAVIKNGWLHTGDLGYLADGEIYVTGRIKEIIIVAGRNYFPTDIEHAVSQLPEIRTGNVVAFGVSRPNLTEGLVICAETKLAMPDRSGLEHRIRSRVMEAVGLVVDDIVLLDVGILPKTSSGKLQRCDVKVAYLKGGLPRRRAKDSKLTTFKHVGMSQLRLLWSRVTTVRNG
jgi:fatty-acyl-CoA synthase